ncbi:hypothetical protein BOM24_08950 [Tatumella sp. OPLPL6]|nr:hypothetical protein BOM24_08950 [Tatumella sp. OPLPL6]
MITSARFISVPSEKWPQKLYDPRRVAVWLSHEFLVQQIAEENGVIRLTINLNYRNGNGRWQDGISWDELQQIKNAVGFSEYDAVEVYPKESDLVNVANMRHLWILPEPLPFVWRSDDKRTD